MFAACLACGITIFCLPIAVGLVVRALFATTALIVMLQINVLVTLIIFLPLAVIVPIIHLAGNRIAAYRRRSREALGRVTGFLGESFGAAQAIKLAGATPHLVVHFRA